MEIDHTFGQWSGSSESLFQNQYPLHQACRDGDLERLSSLLSRSTTPNFYEEDGFYGWTPTHWAAHFGKLSCLMKLLENGASFDAVTERFNQSPSHLAALNGKGHCLKWLLHCGALINRQDYLGETPIHKAARTGSMECVSLLVSQGAKLSIKNHNGHTPSQLAAECGHNECAIYIQRAAEVQDQSSGVNHELPLTIPSTMLSHNSLHNTSLLQCPQGINGGIPPGPILHSSMNVIPHLEENGMEISDMGPAGDAGLNGMLGMKRCRDDEIVDDSMKRMRKADPLWTENNNSVRSMKELTSNNDISHPSVDTGLTSNHRTRNKYDPNHIPVKCMMGLYSHYI